MTDRPYVLSEAALPTVRDSEFQVAVLPWGATEAHNLHLPYGTDNYECDAIAHESARLAWERGTRVIVLPTIPVGANAQQLDIPLTLNLNPTSQMAVLTDIVASLDASGIRRLVVFNGHGGNDFRWMVRELQPRAQLFMCVVNWYQYLSPDEFFDELGDHAGEMETSIMLHIAPQLVAMDDAGSGHAKKFKIEALREGRAWAPRRWSQVTADTGVGNPAAASSDKGARYFRELTRQLGEFFCELAAADCDDLYH
jgi:creatinine amidohydrolase